MPFFQVKSPTIFPYQGISDSLVVLSSIARCILNQFALMVKSVVVCKEQDFSKQHRLFAFTYCELAFYPTTVSHLVDLFHFLSFDHSNFTVTTPEDREPVCICAYCV